MISGGGPGSGRWQNKITKSGRPHKKPGPKTDPNAPHNSKIQEVIARMKSQGFEHIGGGKRTEISIPTPGGLRPYRRMDASFRDPRSGSVIHYNVGQTNLRGDPIMRERKALVDVMVHGEGAFSDYLVIFEGYRP